MPCREKRGYNDSSGRSFFAPCSPSSASLHMSATCSIRKLRLLAFGLLLICAPVLDAADCCCRHSQLRAATADKSQSPAPACCSPKPTRSQTAASCCQTKPDSPTSPADSCRIPPAKTCGCCVATAPLTAAQRPGLKSAADALHGLSASAIPVAAVAANTNNQPPAWTPAAGNRRQAVLCCWRN